MGASVVGLPAASKLKSTLTFTNNLSFPLTRLCCEYQR